MFLRPLPLCKPILITCDSSISGCLCKFNFTAVLRMHALAGASGFRIGHSPGAAHNYCWRAGAFCKHVSGRHGISVQAAVGRVSFVFEGGTHARTLAHTHVCVLAQMHPRTHACSTRYDEDLAWQHVCGSMYRHNPSSLRSRLATPSCLAWMRCCRPFAARLVSFLDHWCSDCSRGVSLLTEDSAESSRSNVASRQLRLDGSTAFGHICCAELLHRQHKRWMLC